MLTDLNPWVVGLHMLLSLAIIQVAVLLLRRSYGAVAAAPTHPLLGWATLAAGWAVLYVGTVVTGAGPNSGDASAPRNGLDPDRVAPAPRRPGLPPGRPHRGLAAARTTPAARRPPRRRRARRRRSSSRQPIGFAQYFNGNPGGLVMFHLVGTALVAAALSWLFLTSTART